MRVEKVERSRDVTRRGNACGEKWRAIARRLRTEAIGIGTDHPVKLLPRRFLLQQIGKLPASIEEQRAHLWTPGQSIAAFPVTFGFLRDMLHAKRRHRTLQ